MLVFTAQCHCVGPNASLYDPTPVCTTQRQRLRTNINPNADVYKRPRCLEPNPSVYDPTPMCMAQHLCFEPSTSINPTPTFTLACRP
ncbi:hypothetical protein K443DRAFT_665006 [Laccaria amethystina LaAM-08-1]|uniref:Unplaced genomic scaffold K443scaffold_89, whole genome shotgun sequence n=1 Tax=Laccaria amethystina LaAM-08-1 TaxID=1095629 RepID=A0A0C9XFX6_9AGAR|nr:hypothetical protein K443DRAFT_665006 [Laccaria amethystina LaAM-08-1]